MLNSLTVWREKDREREGLTALTMRMALKKYFSVVLKIFPLVDSEARLGEIALYVDCIRNQIETRFYFTDINRQPMHAKYSF